MQKVHTIIYPWHLFPRVFGRLTVVVESLIVEDIFIELGFCVRGALLQGLSVFLPLFVAVVALVLFPISKAKPAEFKPALAAGHVVASLILLYRTLAFWARLGVGLDPVHIFTIRLFLVFPSSDLLAAAWVVVLLSTKDAVSVATLAHDAADVGVRRYLSQVVATLERAPLHAPVSVRELPAVPLQIFRLVWEIRSVL